MNLCLYLAARPVSVCFPDRILALILRLDFSVSGGLVEDDHHARTLEDSVFCYLVAVSVHVTFVLLLFPVCCFWCEGTVEILNTDRSTPYILVLTGSECIITDITEYTYISLLETLCELKYKSE